jgi:DNA-binding NarL/FixJ family response regulator
MRFASPFFTKPPHLMAGLANMPDTFLALPGMRKQGAHHQRRQARSRAAHAMRYDGYTIKEIALQLNISQTTVCGYFSAP